MGILCCPVCGAPLSAGEKTRICARGHSFDRAAKGGYVNLRPALRRGSADPGDSREMCAARTEFLSGGWYAPLQTAVAEQSAALAPRTILDAGCGEGYYTAAVQRANPAALLAGIDLSKYALRHAGRVCAGAELAVASLFSLPVADGSVDLITHLFAPLCAPEFARVLRPGGALLTVTPGARHLWGMKQLLYDAPYENETAVAALEGFAHAERTEVRATIALTTPADIRALYLMTPYAWKTGKDGAARLLAAPALTSEIAFLLDRYVRTD